MRIVGFLGTGERWIIQSSKKLGNKGLMILSEPWLASAGSSLARFLIIFSKLKDTIKLRTKVELSNVLKASHW